ncbi:MAG: hypothetical protein ABSH28_18160 [Acidobacteriota bacterium]|jgi:hypothetical protein
MKHIGMDIDSTNTHISVFSDRGREIKRTHVATREADLVAFLLSIPGPKQVALEESQMADFVTRIMRSPEGGGREWRPASIRIG